MTLHWICDSPSPYNAELFRALAAAPGLDLQVHYRKTGLKTHPWHSALTDGYRWRVLRPRLGVDWTLVGLALSPYRQGEQRQFVLAGWNHATAWLVLLFLGLRRAGFMVWTDTPDSGRARTGWRQAARAAFLKWVFARARFVLGTGAPALDQLRRMGAPEAALVNFPCWIDLDRYEKVTARSAAGGTGKQPLVFLSVGLVENARKGHDVALRALALAAGRTDMAFEYRIAGTGPDAETLQALAGELGLADRVRILGWLEPSEVVEQLAAADVLIHPSPVHEPYGVAVLEAMASGLPVLASDRTCAALDRIVNDRNGMIHLAGDHVALAGQIARLAEDPNRMRQLGDEAAATARQWPLGRGVDLVRSLVAAG